MLCRSRQAWSSLNGINTRDCWVDEAALAAALVETRPAPLAALPDAKRLATLLVNAAKVAASVLWRPVAVTIFESFRPYAW